MAEMKKGLEERTKRFALTVIQLAGSLPNNRVADVLGRQLLRNGTSIGASYREANRAFSHDDFIHKLSICEKEAAESEHWLELISEAHLAEPTACERLTTECNKLLRIFVASGRTAKNRRQANKL